MRDSPRPFARGATQLRRHDGAPLLRDRGEPLSSRNRTGTGAPANDRARRHLGGGAPRLDAGSAADVRVRPLRRYARADAARSHAPGNAPRGQGICPLVDLALATLTEFACLNTTS